MKVLSLTLMREFFEAIRAGQKTVEYREVQPYRINSLEGKQFDEIHFRNGYSADAPFMRVECKGMGISDFRGSPHYCIQLGRILEVID